jgi:hypothetical protein
MEKLERVKNVELNGASLISDDRRAFLEIQQINEALKLELQESQKQVAYERENLKSLGTTMEKLKLKYEETIVQQRLEAEKISETQSELELNHAKELQVFAGKISSLEMCATHSWSI